MRKTLITLLLFSSCMIMACGKQGAHFDTTKIKEATPETVSEITDDKFLPSTPSETNETTIESEENTMIFKTEKEMPVSDVNTFSEKEARKFLTDRGFSFAQFTPQYEYDMDGTFHDAKDAEDIDVKHPAYTYYYMSSEQELWTITLTGKDITAYPVSYAMESTRKTPLLITESPAVMVFDSKKNTLSVTIPKTSELLTHEVDKITPDTLNTLTCEYLAGL